MLCRSTFNLHFIIYPNFWEALLRTGQHWLWIRLDLIHILDWLKPRRKAAVFACAVAPRGIFSR